MMSWSNSNLNQEIKFSDIYLVLLGGVGACLPNLLVFLLSWTTVLLLDKSPCDPAGVSNSEVGVGWEDLLPKVESMGWDSESKLWPVLGELE